MGLDQIIIEAGREEPEQKEQPAPKRGPGRPPKTEVPANPYKRALLAVGPLDKPARKGQLEVVPTEAELSSTSHVCRGGKSCRDSRGLLMPGHARGVEKRHFDIGWRAKMDRTVDLDELWRILLKIARGKPTKIKNKQGREEYIIPAASDQLRAAIELAHMKVGKPVSQAEILAAEKASTDLEAAKGLGDEELKRRVAQLLMQHSTDAEIVPDVPALGRGEDEDEDDGIA
jgi:hypothetical protein